MPLPKIPTFGLDDINHIRRTRETINSIIDHSFDDFRRQTPAEKLAGVTPVNYAYPPGDVRRYGADPTGTVSSYAAVMASLSVGRTAYLPAGVYLIDQTITITGTTVVIRGDFGGTYSAQTTLINWTGSGNLFNATGTEFGGLYIGHLQIMGGSGDGEYAILSTRPQSVYEYLHFEHPSTSAGFNNPGIMLSSALQGSWGSKLRECKWVGPNAATDFRGFLIDIDGGNVDLDFCLATRGSVGCEILKGETIRLNKCNFNLQDSTFSSESVTAGQCAVRLSGTAAKKCISLDDCYLEGSTTLVWAEDVECLSITDTFCDDLGSGNTGNIKLRGSTTRNTRIVNTHIRARLNGGINIDNAGANTTIEGCVLTTDGDATSVPLVNTGTMLITRNNRFVGNVAGAAYSTTQVMIDQGNVLVSGTVSDASGLVQYMFPSVGSWTPVIAGSTTPGSHTYTTQQGNYSMIGRRVVADFVIVLSAKDVAMAGNVRITGLPFTARNLSVSASAVAFSSYDNVNLSAGYTQLTAVVSANTTVFSLIEDGDNVASASVGSAAIASNTALRGTVSYDI